MDLKNIATLRPCDNCPFRSDVVPFLRYARVAGIYADAKRGQHFVCHKTVDYTKKSSKAQRAHVKMCAGFAILCRRDGLLGGLTIVQLAERLLKVTYDPVKTGTAKVYESFITMLDAHRREI